jgi:peroxiredoxin
MTTEKDIFLEQQLAARRNEGAVRAPQVAEVLQRENARIVAEGLRDKALREGQVAPDFSLPAVNGQLVTLSQLLAQGPVVLTFYRGEWCPYCNLTLRAYQQVLPEIKALGASLVAISPQTPDHSLSMAEKNALEFEVLSDEGSKVIERYGLLFRLSPALQKLMQGFGTELAEYNGEDSWQLPVPGTYVIRPDGMVVLAFVDPDYTRRLEPARILAALRQL